MTDLVSLIKAAIETAPHRQMNGRIDYQSMAEAAANLWQPIETAEKNSTERLVYDRGEMFVAWYDVITDAWRWVDERYDAGWCVPTHWMPLPKPPQT